MTTDWKWYVGQTRPGLGSWAEKNLAAQQILSYSPRIVSPDGVSGENLFPRYLFVQLPPLRRAFSVVNSTRGMHKLLPLYSEEPLSVPTSYVDELRVRVGLLGTIDAVEEVTYDYAKKQNIEVTSGPWAGHVGSYEYRKKGVAMLMMRMMGRELVVPVPLSSTRALVSVAAPC